MLITPLAASTHDGPLHVALVRADAPDPSTPPVPPAQGAMDTPELPEVRVPAGGACTPDAGNGEDHLRAALFRAPVIPWTSHNMGPGSCLDADLLDGHHAADFFAAVKAEAVARALADQGLDLRVDGLRLEVDEELAALRSADEGLAGDLAGEQGARLAADQELQGTLKALGEDAKAKHAALAAADDALAQSLLAERAARLAEVQDALRRVDEVQARLGAEAEALAQDLLALQGVLAAEASDRTLADAALDAGLQSLRLDLGAEAARRQANDTALGARATAVEGRATSLEAWTRAPVVQGPGNAGQVAPGGVLTFRQPDPVQGAFLLTLQHNGVHTLHLAAASEGWASPQANLHVTGQVKASSFRYDVAQSEGSCGAASRGTVQAFHLGGQDFLKACLQALDGTHRWVALN